MPQAKGTGKPSFESFVPQAMLAILKDLEEDYGRDSTRPYNDWFYKNKPKVPRSTVRRWTLAFVQERAHSDTPDWHKRYREDVSLIPSKFSDLRNGKWADLRNDLHKSGGIRYVNAGDFHRPRNDGALLSLLMMVVKDFKPNVFPYFSDWLEQDQFKRHASDYRDGDELHTDATVSDRGAYPTNRYGEFEYLVNSSLDMFEQVLDEGCLKINLWGNHEDWILKHLFNMKDTNGDGDIFEYYVDKIFTELQNRNVLWLEPDRNLYIPLTDTFWITHGRLSRTTLGGTGRAYANKVKYAVSIAAQHTHRQELTWVETPLGDKFYAICGTLSDRIRAWNMGDYRGHNWGFQLIDYPTTKNGFPHVENVRIYYRDGYYVCKAMGREYSIPTEVQYDGTTLYNLQ